MFLDVFTDWIWQEPNLPVAPSCPRGSLEFRTSNCIFRCVAARVNDLTSFCLKALAIGLGNDEEEIELRADGF